MTTCWPSAVQVMNNSGLGPCMSTAWQPGCRARAGSGQAQTQKEYTNFQTSNRERLVISVGAYLHETDEQRISRFGTCAKDELSSGLARGHIAALQVRRWLTFESISRQHTPSCSALPCSRCSADALITRPEETHNAIRMICDFELLCIVLKRPSYESFRLSRISNVRWGRSFVSVPASSSKRRHCC